MNLYSAVGRIGKDAVTRTAGTEQVTSFSLAVDAGFGTRKQTLWVDCNVWGKRGTGVAKFLTKGSRVAVSGELGTRDHDGKTYLTLRVNEVTLCGEKKAA